MSDRSDGTVTHLFERLRAGDADAVGPLWDRYLPRLLGLARKTLAGRSRSVTDADDAVQSAFASFWRRADRGEFGGPLGRDDLWNLLAVITVRKARQHLRRELAEKRGGGRVVSEADLSRSDGSLLPLEDAAHAMPSADFDLHSEELLLSLDEELRVFAVMRLLGYLNREIAEQLDCTERKVERKLELIRLKWDDRWPD